MARSATSSRGRWVGVIAALFALPLVVVALVTAGASGVFAVFTEHTTPAPRIEQPERQRYDPDQLANAASIMSAGRDLGLSVRDQAIGVMTALGESSLRNIDYGDWETSGVTNPDGTPTTSIGLFQQQDGWGTREQRLDPHTSATLFYRAMIERVPDREAVAPTTVAHRTQINRDADHYARYWPLAVELVETLSGQDSGLTR